MANMQATKTPMPEQDPNVRNKNFKEVTLGYTAEMAINEAKRCLQCKKPHCVEGCPVNIHIPEFIHEVAEGNFEKAYEIITDTNALPALSGRVCPNDGVIKGSWLGLTMRHDYRYLYRAIVESLAYEYKMYLDIIQESVLKRIPE